MTYYHGTIAIAAASIKKTGLTPHRKSAYRMLDDDGTPIIERSQLCYLTANRTEALRYAHFRHDYSLASCGETVTFKWKTGVTFRKLANNQLSAADAIPALITFDIPESLSNTFRPDRGDKFAVTSSQPIPPQYIVRIQSLKESN